MTSTSVPINPGVRNEAQGPHTLGRTGGRYYVRMQDIPTGALVEHVPGVLRLQFIYEGDDDHSPSPEPDDFTHGVTMNLEGLRLVVSFLKSKRRVMGVEFEGFDPLSASPERLAAGIGVALASLGTSEAQEHTGKIDAQELLAVRAVGAMCRSLLPRIVRDIREDANRPRKR